MDDARPPLNVIAIGGFVIAVLGSCAVIGVALGSLPFVQNLNVDQKFLTIYLTLVFIASSIASFLMGIIGFVQAHRRGQSGLLFALLATLYGVAGIGLTIVAFFFLADIKSFLP